MKKLLIPILVILLSNFNCSSQNNSNDQFKNKYVDYFGLNNETIFTHLNKSIFFKDEELWFKTYIYDLKTQTPYISTTNVYVSIYDEKGTLVTRKLFFADSGTTHGNFKLDSLFSAGVYFLKTHTNWMKNFNEDYSNIQKFEIMEVSSENNTLDYSQNFYDLQLLPEGGHLVEDLINSIGFKILDSNGKSPKIVSGKVFEGENNLITTFTSNQFGLGKFELKIEKGKEYFCQVTLQNNEIITKPLPKVNATGITLNVVDSRNGQFLIALRTNNNTLSSLINKPYKLIIHRDGLIKQVQIDFASGKTDYVLNIPKENLHAGINILTLFTDKDQPINERIVYNDLITPVKAISVSKIKKEKDSSIITLSTTINKSIPKNLSVSVLPAATVAYNRISTIQSTFLLHPYVNGEIENPGYYFSDDERKTLFDLDLLLITQGWSKYSWDTIFNNPPKLIHDFETGFILKGKLNNYKFNPSDKILLLSKENLIHMYSKIENENHFSFENLYISENSDINFSIEKKNERMVKPLVNYTVYPKNFIDSIDTSRMKKSKNNQNTNNEAMFDMFLSDSINILELVTLKNVTKKIKPKNKPHNIMGAKYLNFSESKNPNSLLTDQIRNNGFDVTNNGFDVKIRSRRNINLRGSLSPTVYLDFIKLDNNDLRNIAPLRLYEVDEMYISKNGSIYASPGGVIHIFTKQGVSHNTKIVFNNSKIDFGFSNPKEYYSPKYDQSKHEYFSKYGVIQWVPNVTMNSQGELSFKIPNYTHDTINLYIEGMGDDGSLISTIEKIKIKK